MTYYLKRLNYKSKLIYTSVYDKNNCIESKKEHIYPSTQDKETLRSEKNHACKKSQQKSWKEVDL